MAFHHERAVHKKYSNTIKKLLLYEESLGLNCSILLGQYNKVDIIKLYILLREVVKVLQWLRD